MDVPRREGGRRLVRRHAGSGAGGLHPGGRRAGRARRSTAGGGRTPTRTRPVVYYLHGVRWNLTGHVRRMEQLRRFGFSVFAIDYRGFGKSDGDLPSEPMTYEDAAAGWAWLAKKVPDPARRFIYGHSLGGAVAIDLAARLAAQAPGNGAGARPDRRVDVHLAPRHRRRAVVELAADAPHPVAAVRFDREGPQRSTCPILFVHGTGDRLRAGQVLAGAVRRRAAAPRSSCSSRTAATTTRCGSATANTRARSATSSRCTQAARPCIDASARARSG